MLIVVIASFVALNGHVGGEVVAHGHTQHLTWVQRVDAEDKK
jgi:hypothetical protein